jgi:hypothetical protein
MVMARQKSTNYFSHDSNARNDEKLVRLRMKQGAAGYGVYFMILERLREEADYMSAKDYNMIAFDLRVDAAIVKSVVEDFGLFTFTDDGKCFYSESFTQRMDIKDTLRRQRSDGGKIGMKNRWKKEQGKQDKEVKPQPKAASAPTPKAATKREQSSSLELPSVSRFGKAKPAPTAQPAGNQACLSCRANESRTMLASDLPSAADNQACLKRFFGKENASNLEVLLMNFGLKPDDITMIRKVAKEVVAEWEISKKGHTDYTDWSQHLIATMRIKVKDRQQAKGKTAINETEPPSSADYQFDGGFGSKDV